MDKLLAERYEMQDKIGQGGMGAVYKGIDTQTNTIVAIKHLHGTISDDDTIIERFKREAQALRDLNHPNIVKMLALIQEDYTYYLITEYIDGGDLAALLKQKNKLSVEAALKMGLELADALSRAHHLGIIHRDIKPANVLIASDGTPRLTDFGVAHMESEERLTGTGMSVGTVDYLPPEAVTGEAVDVRADVWSFGVMLYEMLTSERPFTGSTIMQIMTNILREPAPDLYDVSDDFPSELNDLIQRMLMKDREERIRSMRQVGATLEAILDGDVSGLHQLQTPIQRQANLPQSPVVLEDAPTTPAQPILTAPDTSPPQSDSLPNVPSEKPTFIRREYISGIVVFVMALLLLAAGSILFSLFGLGAEPEPPTPIPTETSTPTPEPTATTVPIVGDAPDGYKWINAAEVQMAVPQLWISVPLEAVLEIGMSFVGDDDDQAFLDSFLEQQRDLVTYGNFLDFSGMMVMIEETAFTLPDSIMIERINTLGERSGAMVIDEPRFIETHLGKTLYGVWGVPDVDDGNTNFFVIYSIYREDILYTIGLSALGQAYGEQQAIFDTIVASIQIGEPIAPTPEPTTQPSVTPIAETAETTPDTTDVIINSMPDEWQVAQGDQTAFAVPQGFIITSGANRMLIDASLRLVMGNMEAADDASTLFDQMNIDVISGFLQGVDLMFVSTVVEESVLSLDVETADSIISSLFTTIADDQSVSFDLIETKPTTLPIGDVLRTDMLVSVGERPPFRSVYFLHISEDGLVMNVIAFSFLDSEFERLSPLMEQIAQTFTILE